MARETPLEHIRVFSINEALDALGEYGDDAALFAGGTDVLIQIKEHAIRPLYLIDLEGISQLGAITEDIAFLNIGTLVTLRQVEKCTALCSMFPALVESARQVGSVQLRNTATVGGNLGQRIRCPYYNQSHINLFMRESMTPCLRRGGKICHTVKWGREVSHAVMASPNRCTASFGSNLAIALATLEGCAVVASKRGSRDVPIESLYKENGDLDIASDEILTNIKIPVSKGRTTVFLQYKANPASYTVLTICASLVREDDGETCKNMRVWLGGVAPRPYRAKEVEEYLKGKKLNQKIIEKSSRLLFESLHVLEPVMVFKVAKARVLCREALSRAFEGSS